MFLKYGVDSIKLNLSGDNFTQDSPADTTWMSDAEVAAAMDEVRVRGKRGTAHARSAASVKQALRHGIDVIYHASYTDSEIARHARGGEGPRLRRPRHRHHPTRCSTRPSRGASPTPRRSRWATSTSGTRRCESLRAMHKRGIRILPGGDYGFALTPHGQNARDLEFFVKYLGFTPMEAIRSATLYGGQIMMKPTTSSASSRTASLPTCCSSTATRSPTSSILRDPKRLLAVMKDGVFAKAPEIAAERAWVRAA